jgi:uncharacterized protein involved in response to NO
MSTIAMHDITEPRANAFLSHGFRPFFLLGALWAIGSLVLWILAFALGIEIPSRFDPMSWHIHEMLFGFVMAAIAGFLLTAIPNWTVRLPVRNAPLAGLVTLWILGRVVTLFSAALPVWLALAGDLAFPMALIAVAGREIVAGRNWRNLLMLVPISLFGLANLLMHVEAMGFDVPTGIGWRLGLGAVIVLIAIVGGRIIPSFTRNWLAKRPGAKLPAPFGWVDRVALLAIVLALLCWVVQPDFQAVGLVLLAVSVLHFWRLSRWRGMATGAEPLLVILHVAYAWLPIGIGLLGLSVLDLGVPQSAAIHALTAGTAATMILAVMTRATRGHTGRDLVADRATSCAYLFINLAAMTRVIAAFAKDWTMPLLGVSAIFWIAAFAFFVSAYAGMLVGPRK